MPRYDGDPVVVIGGGPVGTTAALLLARWGIPAVVVDRLPARERTGSKAICQQRDVLDVWAAVGAGHAIAEAGVTWTTARTFYRDTELFSVEFRDRGRSPFPPWVNLSQADTERVLDDCVAAATLVDVRWGHEVVGLDQDAGGATLTCATPDGLDRIRASYVLACAGVRSGPLRELLGVALRARSFDDRFLICDLRADLPGWETERRFHFDPAWNPGRQVLIHPCPDSTYRIDWQVPPDFDLEAEEASGALDARIRRVVGDRPYEVVWRSVYRFSSGHADRLRAGRVLLAGDCAHVLAPFGARGLNSGVQDAENAAWKLAFVLHGWAPDALLDSYASERLAAARENLEVTAATMRFLVPHTEAERVHRSAVLQRAVVEPAARAEVDSGRLAEPYWYVDSPLTTPDPTRPRATRPPPGQAPPPGPGVLVPDVPVAVPGSSATRLREVVRDGVLALTGDGVDPGGVAGALAAATRAPTRVLAVPDLDRDGGVAEVLGLRPGEVWVIRPDGHVTAVVPAGDLQAASAAVRRALAAG